MGKMISQDQGSQDISDYQIGLKQRMYWIECLSWEKVAKLTRDDRDDVIEDHAHNVDTADVTLT